MFQSGDFSHRRHQNYDSELRSRYQELFLYCEFIRYTSLNSASLSALVPLAAWLPVVTEQLVSTVLGGRPVIDLSFPFRFVGRLLPRI